MRSATHYYLDHQILLTAKLGRWHYQVRRMVPSRTTLMVLVPGPVVSEGHSLTRWHAKHRARDTIRRARERGARWPSSPGR